MSRVRPTGVVQRVALITSWQGYLEKFGGFDRAVLELKAAHDASAIATTIKAIGTGIRGLMLHEDVTMVICPDLDNIARKWTVEDGTPKRGEHQPVIWKGVQQEMLAHCIKMGNRMAILDTPPHVVEPQDVTDWRKNTAVYDTAYGALYYPWIKVVDPHPGAEGLIDIPPSGHVAGVWARNDLNRGVWKAPANEPLNTVQGVAKQITQVGHEDLNSEGINAIRSFGSRGIRLRRS